MRFLLFFFLLPFIADSQDTYIKPKQIGGAVGAGKTIVSLPNGRGVWADLPVFDTTNLSLRIDSRYHNVVGLPDSTGFELISFSKRDTVRFVSGGTIPATPKMLVSLLNYEGDRDLAYPLGIFSTDGRYLGIANSATEYQAIWNADSINSFLGKIVSGTGTQFVFEPTFINLVVNLYGLEYYTINGFSGMILHLDDEDIVQYENTLLNPKNYPVINAVTKREYNMPITSNFFHWKTDDFTYRAVTIDNATPKIFHSRRSKTFGVELSNGFISFSGVLPRYVKSIYSVAQAVMDYRTISNWNDLSAVKWLNISHYGAGVWNLNPNYISRLFSDSLMGINLGDLQGTNILTTIGTWLNKDNYDTIRQLVLKTNGTELLISGSHTFFANLPIVTELIEVGEGAGSFITPSIADAVLNSLASRLAGVTPIGQKLININRIILNRTTASDAAVAQLTGAGWTVQ